MGLIQQAVIVADQYRIRANAPVTNEQLLASLAREVEVSLRLQPEQLPWRRSTDFGWGRNLDAQPNPPRRRKPPVEGRRDTAQDERVVQVLAAGPLLRRDIEAELGLPRVVVAKALWHLQRAGRVTYEGPHNVPRWRLTEPNG